MKLDIAFDGLDGKLSSPRSSMSQHSLEHPRIGSFNEIKVANQVAATCSVIWQGQMQDLNRKLQSDSRNI